MGANLHEFGLGLTASKNRQKSYPQFGKDKLMTSIKTCISIFATFLVLAATMTAPVGAVSEAEKIVFTDAEKEWLAAHSKIVVGGEKDWAPFDFVDRTGKYVGIADDYLKIIGEKLGIEVEMVTGPSWDELLTMLRRQEIDVLPAIYHSKEREAYVHFTAPYIKLNEFIFTSSDNQTIASFEDLKDHTIVVVKGYTIEGYERIAIVRGPQNISTGIGRFQGGIHAMEDYDIQPSPELIYDGDFFMDSGYAVAKNIMSLSKDRRPQAIYSCNDEMAVGILEAFWEIGVRVPEEMALIGNNNTHVSSLGAISLSTISHKKREMGRLAATRLIERLESKNEIITPRQITLDPDLVVRNTCGYMKSEEYRIESTKRHRFKF